ncbi:Cof-type HAD-IIB family hydrolase [Vibrio sp. JC009]|uniref:HAD-IIB family hydrolase n=1 Tax=Vibrio sp. JC009 TaxID=2912314 RepID=UPI0023B179C6|nr:HAD family hydrolase [Vibrio sp. JC009]WED24539.1 Cof-type HAD-IIB family hydrolase [Vibrio sp. JC009]
MSKKIIASDYDKTFFYKTDPSKLPRNLEAVKNWRNQGNLFAISTGRDAASIRFERKARDVDYDYLIALNGSLVVDSEDNILFKAALENGLARDVAEMLKQRVGDELIVSNGFDGCNFTNRAASLNDAVAREVFERNSQIYTKSVEQALDGEVLLLGCLCSDLEEAQSIRSEILGKYASEVEVFINLNYINVVPKGISKASGLELIVEQAAIREELVSVIGDDYNDIPMLERFTGYAVENAKDEVKQASEKVYPAVADLISDKL